MSGKKLLFYVLALVLVAGGYFFSEYYHSRQELQEQAAKKVFPVNTEAIGTITLKTDEGEIELQRLSAPEKPSDKEASPAPALAPWQITKPITSRADDLTITSMLNALAELQLQRRLEAPPADKLKEFGLEKPLFTVVFQADGQTRTLRFGHPAPGGKSVYAQKDEDPVVFLLSTADKETLNRNLTALRHKGIFTLTPEKITEIRLARNQDRLTLRKSGPGVWSPGDQSQTKLRGDRIEALGRQLSLAQAVDFVAEKADNLRKYGLAPTPGLRLTLLSGQEEETLLVGGKQGERFYAQKSGTNPVFLVDKALVEKLPVSYGDLEDRRLWDGQDAEVQKVVWGPPDRLITALREKEGWSIQVPGSPARQEPAFRVNLAFWKLKELEYGKLLKPADFRNIQPKTSLQLFGPEDKLLFRLEELAIEKDQVQVRFRQAEKDLVGLVPGKGFAELKDNLDRLAVF